MKNKLLALLFFTALYQSSNCMLTIPAEWLRRKLFPPKKITYTSMEESSSQYKSIKQESYQENVAEQHKEKGKKNISDLAKYDQIENLLISVEPRNLSNLLEELLENKIQIDLYENEVCVGKIDVKASLKPLKRMFFESLFISDDLYEPKVKFIEYIIEECKIDNKITKDDNEAIINQKQKAIEPLNSLKKINYFKDDHKSIIKAIESFFNQFKVKTILKTIESNNEKQNSGTKLNKLLALMKSLHNAIKEIIQITKKNKEYISQKQFISQFLAVLEAAKSQIQYIQKLNAKLTNNINATRIFNLISNIIKEKSFLLNSDLLKIVGIGAGIYLGLSQLMKNKKNISDWTSSKASNLTEAALEKAKEAPGAIKKWATGEKTNYEKLQEKMSDIGKPFKEAIKLVKNESYGTTLPKKLETYYDKYGYDAFSY
jgi:hypothetical protein